MKKIFTLVSIAFCAMSVNAQEVWDASNYKLLPEATAENPKYNVVDPAKITKEDNTSEGIVIHDENDVLPYPGEGNSTDPNTVTNTSSKKLQNLMIKAETTNVLMKFNVTPNIGDEDGAFSYGLGVNPNSENTNNKSLSTDKCSPKFLDYIKAKSGNAVSKHAEWWEYNADGNIVHKADDLNSYWTLEDTKTPVMSANIEFTSKVDGTMKVGIYVNKNLNNNVVYVLDVNADGTYTALSPNALMYEGYINNNSKNSEGVDTWLDATAAYENYKIPTGETNPFLGYLSFEMKASKIYKIFVVKNQIGLYGFEFTPSGSGISDITATDNADAPVYNLAGQRVSKDTKGLLIKNGKKFINK